MKTMLIIHIAALLLLSACSVDGFKRIDTVEVPVPGPTVTVPGPTNTILVPAPVVPPTDIEVLVQSENYYRLGLGQTALSNGLSCVLYTTTGGDRIQASIAGHNTLIGLSQVASFTYKGVFNQPDSNVNTYLNVLPAAIQPLYVNNYLLRCQGQLVVTTTGYYTFDLTSDDGSLLYLDGGKLIDNDNNHGATLVSGQKYLRRGVHSFRLDFAETGSGNQALILKANSDFISPEFLYH